MRRRAASMTVVSGLAVLGALLPLRAAPQADVLRCSGSAVFDITFGTFEERYWILHDGWGSCRGIGGPYVAALSGTGVETIPFSLNVRLKLSKASSGYQRTFYQTWTGLRASCSAGRFVVAKRNGVPIGTGNLKLCPLFEDSTKATFTWNFVPV